MANGVLVDSSFFIRRLRERRDPLLERLTHTDRWDPATCGMVKLEVGRGLVIPAMRRRYAEAFADGWYLSGDIARRDEDGYYWITGRVDDVINVSGHRLGTAEVESALVGHGKVAEAAVVGFPHDIKGQGIYAYVTLMAGVEPSVFGTQCLRK